MPLPSTPEAAEHLLKVGHRTNSTSYAPAPVILSHGKGVYLYDHTGREYLDFVAGIAVNALGYDHPRITQTIQQQATRLLHVSNMFFTKEQIDLMEALTSACFADRVFLCNSGAEANEAMIKLARRYQHEVKGEQGRHEIITMRHSFHGRTYGALSATAQPKYHQGFGPMLPGFPTAEYNDLESVRALVGPKTAAIMLEPIQGEGGVQPATPEFLQGIREVCDEHGLLMLLDEVQSGVGRTGALFAHQGYGVEPDVMALAKGLGGGVPIGATLATEKVYEAWQKGSHATTFGGNPLVSAVAKTVLEVIEEDALCEHALQMGHLLMAGLRDLSESYPIISQVRGRGLMVGAEVGTEAAGPIATEARAQGLLINTAGGHTLRFVPPLIVTPAHIDQALERLERALATWSSAAA